MSTPTPHTLVVQRTPRGATLQHHKLSLRPIVMAGAPYFFVKHRLFPARVLITHVLDHTFDLEPSLPDPEPLPPAITDLSPDALSFLTDHCAGTDRNITLSAEDRSRRTLELARAGIALSTIGVNAQLVSAIQYARLQARAQLEPDNTPDPARPNNTPDANPHPNRPRNASLARAAFGTDYGTIIDVTPEELDRVISTPARVPTRWPWARMGVSQRVVIPADEAVRAQSAVHAYAAKSGRTHAARKQFRTERHPVTRDLIVYRVA